MAESPATNNNSAEIAPMGPQLRTMFAELLAETKNDILDQLKLSIDKVYTDFELVETPEVDEGSEVAGETSSRASLAAKIDQLAAPVPSPITVTGDNADFKALALEFSTVEKTSAALQTDLAELVNGLINDKVPKEKLDQLQDKYLRPENCPWLMPPKVNKQIWQQLRQETRNSDSAFQKAQGFLMSGIYALLQLCNESKDTPRDTLIHTVVLLMSANREINLKRRDLLRPDLNKQFGALCNPSTSLSTFLFGDDLNKEVEDLTKANKLSVKVNQKQRFTPYRIPSTSTSSRSQSHHGQQNTRVRSFRPRPFLGADRGQSRAPPPARFQKNKM